jgi:hypothetical protein
MPNENPISGPSLAVLVSSCDSYSDLWPYFFHFFFSTWKNPAVPVNLLANHMTYADQRVNTLQVGNDVAWSDNLQRALQQVRSEYVILILEDFFFATPVDEARVLDACRQLHRIGGKYLALDQFGDLGDAVPGTEFRVSGGDDNLHAGLNLSLWRTGFLREIAQPGKNIWQAESALRARNRAHEPGVYYMQTNTTPIFTYCESVRGLFWKQYALDFLASHGLRPNLRRRPCPNQSDSKLARMHRSLLKRRMKIASWLRTQLVIRGIGSRVLPLPQSP